MVRHWRALGTTQNMPRVPSLGMYAHATLSTGRSEGTRVAASTNEGVSGTLGAGTRKRRKVSDEPPLVVRSALAAMTMVALLGSYVMRSGFEASCTDGGGAPRLSDASGCSAPLSR